ncbi:MAG: hypothetical protein R3C52_10440 [Hyphomonadaceae bacterium]
MTEEEEIEREVARNLLTMFPPSIRRSVFGSRAFQDKYKFASDATLSFSGSDISINRSDFFPAVRALYSGGARVDLKTADGRAAHLEVEPDAHDGRLRLTVESESASLPSFWFFSPDADMRLREFDREVSQRTLPASIVSNWRTRFAESALSDREAQDLHEVFADDPREVETAIGNELHKEEANLRVLVPRSMEYYHRLLGDFQESTGVDAYLNTTAPSHFNHLLQAQPHRALLLCLQLCAHQSMAPLLTLPEWPAAEVEQFFEQLESSGDRFSQVAGYEVGVRALTRYPGLEPILLRIVKALRDEDARGKNGRLALSAGLFIFVDGELSRISLFKGYTPFIRRLAAIAHAAVIERKMIELGVSLEGAADWAMQGRGQDFFMQSLADLRIEPRWLPDLMTAEQLKNEFLSRIHIASDHAKEQIPAGDLRQLVVEEGPESIKARLAMPFAFLPGPLEGGATAPAPFPQDMLDELKEPTEKKVLEARFFAGVVNLALVFRLEKDVGLLIGEILRAAKYRLSVGGESGVTFSLLAGLAIIAAVTRTASLADDIRVLVRVLRARGDFDAEPDSQLRIGLIASAAHQDVPGWCKAVGDWFIELSYEPMDRATAQGLRHHLRKLCQAVPDLWPYVSKADAALAAVVGSHHARPSEASKT